LTVWCSPHGSERCSIVCTSMGGSEVAVLDMGLLETVEALHNAVSAQAEHVGHWRLVLPDGTALRDPDLVLVELLRRGSKRCLPEEQAASTPGPPSVAPRLA